MCRSKHRIASISKRARSSNSLTLLPSSRPTLSEIGNDSTSTLNAPIFHDLLLLLHDKMALKFEPIPGLASTPSVFPTRASRSAFSDSIATDDGHDRFLVRATKERININIRKYASLFDFLVLMTVSASGTYYEVPRK